MIVSGLKEVAMLTLWQIRGSKFGAILMCLAILQWVIGFSTPFNGCGLVSLDAVPRCGGLVRLLKSYDSEVNFILLKSHSEFDRYVLYVRGVSIRLELLFGLSGGN